MLKPWFPLWIHHCDDSKPTVIDSIRFLSHFHHDLT